MTVLLAVPSDAPGGFNAEISQHFGHCDGYSLFRIDGEQITETMVVPAEPHENCLVPVRLLALRGVTAIVAYGMGARPLDGFLAAGIQPFHAGENRKVGDVVSAFMAGSLPAFTSDRTCAHHHEDAGCHH